MKRAVIVIFCVIMILSFSGCGVRNMFFNLYGIPEDTGGLKEELDSWLQGEETEIEDGN